MVGVMPESGAQTNRIADSCATEVETPVQAAHGRAGTRHSSWSRDRSEWASEREPLNKAVPVPGGFGRRRQLQEVRRG